MTKDTSSPDILICFGTRPEVIKVASTIQELIKRGIPFRTVFTGQHDELFQDVKHLIPEINFDLSIMEKNQSLSAILTRVTEKIAPVLTEVEPELVIVQGDTTTAVAVALAAFYEGISIGHIEAGLRTYNPKSPFPEEVNRQIISKVAELHWAPTKKAIENLQSEGIKDVILTGNTVIDICQKYNGDISYSNKVLITLHRRENFGDRMEIMFKQIESLAEQHPDIDFIFPLHPNPKVQYYSHIFKKVNVISPLKYDALMNLLAKVKFVITDSGGLQEECAVFQKKVLICRDTTERPEAVESGFAKLIGTEIEKNFKWANDDPVWKGQNPFGDGKAASRIVDSIVTHFPQNRQ